MSNISIYWKEISSWTCRNVKEYNHMEAKKGTEIAPGLCAFEQHLDAAKKELWLCNDRLIIWWEIIWD